MSQEQDPITEIRRLAEQGHGDAQFCLGVMYDNGEGLPENNAEAVKWYRLAADQGDASAQFCLGVMYDNGRGVPEDKAEAVKWYRLAAEQSEASAQFCLGVMYDNGEGLPENNAEAVKWYRLAADQGDASAQFCLGVMYDNGRGVPEDKAEAVKWYRLAAEQSEASAQFCLGVMYYSGEGVSQDYQEAVDWFRKAAAQGHADAQFNLGVMYGRGEGVPENDAEAVKWFRLAADQGDASAQFCLGMGQMFNRGEIVRNKKKPSWGTGRVLETMGSDKVRILFDDRKYRTLDLRYAELEKIAENDGPSSNDHGPDLLEPLPQVDMAKVRSSCERFISAMGNRRRGSDDAGVARLVLKEMETRGRLTLTTHKRLSKWCHTQGSVFQEGTDIAQDISIAIYGRVIPRDDY